MDLLQGLFSSRTRAQIIGLFVSRPRERFYLREVARLIGCDVRSVKLELDHLEGLGFLKSKTSGNRRYMEANLEFSLYPELKRLVIKTSGLGQVLQAALKEVSGIEFAFVYGSVAQGVENKGSDLDLFIVGEISGPLLHKTLSKAKVALHREINTMRLTLKELRERLKQEDSFLKGVTSEKKVFIIGTEKQLKRAISSRTT